MQKLRFLYIVPLLKWQNHSIELYGNYGTLVDKHVTYDI